MELLKKQFEEICTADDSLLIWRKRFWDRFIGQDVSGLQGVCCSQIACQPTDHQKVQSSSILFVDGFFQKADLPSSAICLPLAEAMRTFAIFLQHRLARCLETEKDPFALLNGSFQGGGAFLYIPPHTRIEYPLIIEQRFTSSAVVFPRLHIFLGKGAHLKVVQKIASDHQLPICNSHFDLSLDAGSSLFFGDLQTWPLDSCFFQSMRSTLKRESFFHYFSVSHGAKRSVCSIEAQLLEEGCEALLQGLWKLDGDVECRTRVTLQHQAPNCQSRQHFKGVLRGQSRSYFEGNILVRPEAQKTRAYQLNNHLLLSDTASVSSQPNLEIFADDVKASHGATVSQLKEEELFYLRSRGLSLSDAKEALVEGFCKDLLLQAPAWFVKDHL